MRKKLIIEIGTNSIKTLFAERDGSLWKKVSEDLYPTRIGAGKTQTGKLSSDGMERSLTAIEEIVSIHKDIGLCDIHVIATESLRSANNADVFTNAVKERLGLQVEILSGSEEARFAFLAAVSEPIKPEVKIAVLDIGGGSTELTIGLRDEIIHQQSYPMGAVKLTEKYIHNDPPSKSEIKAVRTFIENQIKDIGTGVSLSELIGVGGTITALALLSIPQEKAQDIQVDEAISLIDRTQLSREQISDYIIKLSALTNQEKEMLPLMPKGRADIILAGTVILDRMMSHLNMQKITVSTRGVRFGYLYSRSN
ncbi:MAG: hypothetical protein R6V77_06350 [Candidatus Cloacimonadaceae bacterium]